MVTGLEATPEDAHVLSLADFDGFERTGKSASSRSRTIRTIGRCDSASVPTASCAPPGESAAVPSSEFASHHGDFPATYKKRDSRLLLPVREHPWATFEPILPILKPENCCPTRREECQR